MSFSFGTPTTNVGLGGTAATATSFGFGAQRPPTTAPPPAFGAVPTLGGAATTAMSTAAPAFGGFGAAPVSAASTLSFGAPGQQRTSMGIESFGSVQNASALPAFGTQSVATATVAPTFSFGQAVSAPTTAPPAFGFVTTPSSAAATMMPSTLGAGVGAFALPGLGAGTNPTTAASLNFNTMTTTATGQPFNTGLSLGGTLASAGGGGIFGKPLTTGTVPATAPPAFVGLGGIDVSATQPKLGDNKQDGVNIKETQVPEEIVKTVDALKTYIKQQKTISSDIGRTPTSKFSNVSHEIMNLKWVLQNMANSVDSNNQQIKLLRSETAKAIQSLEMAQRTQDTPAGLQFEHSAPFQYFQCLVAKYEQDLIAFRQQITLTERHMHALANPQNISPEDLKRGFRQLNESFISLAGRLHELHQRVEEQKEHFLNLRRYRLRDATNVFEKIDNPPMQLVEPQRISSGPTPFSNISAISTLNKSYISATAASNSAPTGK